VKFKNLTRKRSFKNEFLRLQFVKQAEKKIKEIIPVVILLSCLGIIVLF